MSDRGDTSANPNSGYLELLADLIGIIRGMESGTRFKMSPLLAGAVAVLVVAFLVYLYAGQSASPADTQPIEAPASAPIETPAETIPETNPFEAETNPYEGYENPFE